MSERYSMLWNDDLKRRLLMVRPLGQRAGSLHRMLRAMREPACWPTADPGEPPPIPSSLQRKAADELQMVEEEVESRLARVQLLLPDIGGKLASMRPQVCVLGRAGAGVEL